MIKHFTILLERFDPSVIDYLLERYATDEGGGRILLQTMDKPDALRAKSQASSVDVQIGELLEISAEEFNSRRGYAGDSPEVIEDLLTLVR
jgi:hypothetical protein